MRTPNVTTTASQIRPSVAVWSPLVTPPLYAPYRIPPSPAIAAEMVKSANFWRAVFTPDASAATGEERTASMARPDGERSRLRTSHTASSTITSTSKRVIAVAGLGAGCRS